MKRTWRYLPLLVALWALASPSESAQITSPGGGGAGSGGSIYDYRTTIKLQDDFIAGSTTSAAIGTLGWTFANGSITKLEGEANHPGIIRRSTGAVSGTVATFFIYNSAQPFIPAGSSYDIVWLFRLNTNDANTTVRIGTHSMTITDPPGSGEYLEKLDADTNWFFVTRNGGTQTRTNTGVAVGTDWVTLRPVKTGNTSVAFYLNGVLVGTSTTNLPAVGVNPAVTIVNSTAAAKTIDFDYFELDLTGLSR